ncbi:MAG: FkbM family methyltransferase [Bacteroidetes bacterium]|nr:MAG: FkbM family methyltransferase [Bacteroidota bacterium]
MGIIKNILPTGIYNVLFSLYQDYWGAGQTSYANEGEDIILQKIFAHQKTGFYIDIGAYHPKTFSNTFFFYKRGWRGMNIEANTGLYKKFTQFRKRDINLNVGVARQEGTLDLYLCNIPAMNTFSEKVQQERIAQKLITPKGKQSILALPLATILAQHLPDNQVIDFMDIDVEGFEMEVLESNDWEKYRPRIVLAEEYERELASLEDSKVYRFFKERGYYMISKTFSTFFFADGKSGSFITPQK